jgi:hypothetical protein
MAVAAGMHDALNARRELDAALFVDRQFIHVRTKRQRGRTVTVQPRDHARRRRPFEHQAAERRKRIVHELRRLVLVKGRLGVRVEVPSPNDGVAAGGVSPAPYAARVETASCAAALGDELADVADLRGDRR